MTDPATPPPTESPPAPRWQLVSAIDRRVLGVLVEKAKTTPDVYPMTMNSLVTGCNQKNNRDPVMSLNDNAVEESLTRLRQLGAVSLVQGSGRVDKYRHYLYEWLGVDKVELAVMAELLLRGDQTEGELRGRASRMEPIADLAALRPVLASLVSKRLVISLSDAGRGHVVSHGLYLPAELERLRAKYAAGGRDFDATHASAATSARLDSDSRDAATREASSLNGEVIAALQRELADARSEISELRRDLDALAASCRRSEDELRQLRTSLGG